MTLREVMWKVEFSIDFLCTVSEIQNTGHSRRISPWEVVRARFLKKTCWS
ncbi:hypothetical protein BHE74_00057844 [Ensete ventricosum]|nr:hypothetical protein BHE74_00057844 [Ensete ventricosum]